MSDFFTGVTFTEQKVTPSDDAILRRAILPDGILTGCVFSYSGSTLTMGAGSLLICGRQVRHTSVQNWSVVDATSGYARLVLTVDLSRTSTKDTFDQVTDAIEYASSADGFSSLVQADINSAGTRYQIAACVVSLGSGGITGIVQTIGQLDGLQVYAPAGYGLGQDSGQAVTSLAMLDGLTRSGWYRLSVPANDAIISSVNISQATIFVEAYDATTTHQTVTKIGSNTRAERSRINGAWGPWSVENPPMELGVEYRTTELWGDRPVYTKRIAYTADSFTSENVSFPHTIADLDVCISANVLWKRTDTTPDGWRQLPSSDYSTGAWDGHIEYVNSTNIKFRLGSSLQHKLELSTEPVYVTLKYTKL